MEINTKYFGKVSFVEEEALFFENGLFGFDNYKKYLLIRFENDNDSLLCLQNIEDENLAFVVMNPYSFLSDYLPVVTDIDLKDIGADKKTVPLVYNICVLKDNIVESTVNLRCPLIINFNTKRAKQVILDDTKYSFKFPFSQLMKKED